MIVASHQIDLLPFPGFFNRMVMADIFDLGGHYDWWRKGKGIYQHRVMLGFDDNPVWLTLPVIAEEGMTQDNVRIRKEGMQKAFDKVFGIYRPCKNFSKYGDFLEDKFLNPPEYLWQFNLDLLLWLRDTLRITTPLSISRSLKPIQECSASYKVMSQLLTYARPGEQLTYYSGKGGKGYLDLKAYERHGIRVMFQDYSKTKVPEGYRTVSILSMLMRMEPEQVRHFIDGFMI